MSHLTDVYDKHAAGADADVSTFHAMLADLDLSIEESELADVIESFFIYQSMPGGETAAGAAGVDGGEGEMMYPERIWDFETFAKIVALIVDQEGREQ